MGLFTREEKINPETGKFETTKKGLFRGRGERTPITDDLTKQYYKEHPKKSPSYQRKQQVSKAVKTGNSIMDSLFGPPPKKQTSRKTRSNRNYVIQGGIAYPIARPPKRKTNLSSYTSDDYFNFGTPSKKGKKKDYDLFDNHGFW